MRGVTSDSRDAYWARSAVEVVSLLQSGEITPNELLDSLEDRVSEVDRHVNALPTLCFDRARRAARSCSRMDKRRGPLWGLPVAIKDSVPVAAVRTTYGSRAFAEHVPERSAGLVELIEARGGIVYAKSNTPEFEAGANTFNEVFGATRNPWDVRLSAGGSSGGAAVAVATGMAWLAQGTDFACSLRNPASFNGVVGLRPGPGVVPQGSNGVPFQTLSVAGPIARSVADCGLFLDAMAGHSSQDPLSFDGSGRRYTEAAATPRCPARIAFSADLGITAVEDGVVSICRSAVAALGGEGIDVIETHPDMREAHWAFRTLRALQFATAWAHVLDDHRNELKPEVVWNIEEGLALTAEDIVAAERARAAICARVVEFLAEYEFLLLPTAIVPPFPLEQRYVDRCAGLKFDNYLEWMAIAYAISLTACPAISVPCGLTEEGVPVGLQIIARPRAERALLSFAAFVEEMFGVYLSLPIDPRPIGGDD
ncbi:amidase [Ferruginivarius sediminum]|uniref:Amidase n=1 Tax=Ferruginivarius sediminum TaxID=2661937 RepID=A0A369TA82_9PROT|nr:amidase family protein [Ferruginivarius sediminum]RDD62188.1 amidase [Ferruginivarius sediminum]